MTSQTFSISRVQAFCYRYPLSMPVVTSFGKMLDRPAVFVRIEDADGQIGWGEVWANFPPTGAEHRARLVNEVLALRSGEPGPFAQAISGIDLAVWDLYARRHNAPRLAEFGLAWLEEPIRADRPWQEWQQLRQGTDLPLAAGENIASKAGFAEVLGDDVPRVVQPDIAKWGGLSACSAIARDIMASGKTFCPHYLGGGLGLLASAHLLAEVAATVCWKSIPTRSRCAICSAVRSPTSPTAWSD